MFIQDMEIAKNNYLSIIKDKKRDKAYEAVLDHFIDEEKRKEFYKFFKELSANYEILSPDEFLRPYLDDFEILTIMYKVVKENYERGTTINRELTRKTAQLVQNHTKGGIIEPALDVYDINENTLKKIEESNASETEKVFNLIKSINHTVEKNGNIMPYLIPIAERAEQIAKQYESRQKTTKETLSELKKIINNINNAQKEQTEKNMSIDTFTIYWILKDDNFKEPEETAKKMNEILNQYPHWQHSEQYEREVRSNFYSLIMQSSEDGDISKLTKTVQKILDVLKEGKK
jgi:type I restriction enzyme R subunit